MGGRIRTVLREIFERAAQLAPSVIIMDEIDAIAGSRDSANMGYLREVVSQLLVLMDGLAERGSILVIATTNLPNNIDPAILRPGRIDRQIFMGAPDITGRMALFNKFLARMPVTRNTQAEKLAQITDGFSGAEIEHTANEAGLLAIKEAISKNTPSEKIKISKKHFMNAIHHIKNTKSPASDPHSKAIII